MIRACGGGPQLGEDDNRQPSPGLGGSTLAAGQIRPRPRLGRPGGAGVVCRELSHSHLFVIAPSAHGDVTITSPGAGLALHPGRSQSLEISIAETIGNPSPCTN
jgi:hypothetical protein